MSWVLKGTTASPVKKEKRAALASRASLGNRESWGQQGLWGLPGRWGSRGFRAFQDIPAQRVRKGTRATTGRKG